MESFEKFQMQKATLKWFKVRIIIKFRTNNLKAIEFNQIRIKFKVEELRKTLVSASKTIQ